MLLQALLALLSFQITTALYEEQVGVFDWYQQYVGPVSFISIDQTSRTEKAVIVASETGVLAAINSKSGKISWRQVFEPGQNGIINHVFLSRLGALITVSRDGQLLRSWDISSGALKWETTSGLPATPGNKVYPLDENWRPGGVLATLTGKNGGILVLVAGDSVSAFSARTGQVKWEAVLTDIPGGGERVVCGVYTDGRTVYTVSVVDSSVVMVTQFNSSTGATLGEQSLQAPWFTLNSDRCVISESYVVCVKSSRLDFYHAPLSAGNTFTLTMLPSLGVQRSADEDLVQLSSLAGLWLKLGSSQWKLEISDGTVSIVTTLKDGFPLDGVFEDHVTNNDVILKYANEGVSLDIGNERGVVNLPTGSRGTPSRAAVHFITSKDNTMTYLVVVTMEDDSLVLFNKDGIAWEREDGLGVVSAVEMMDLPAGESDLIETFVELTMAESNPFKIAYQRLKLQILLAKEFITSLQQGGVASLVQMDSTELIRDEFSTRKLIITATANGKVYGLDSRNGDVVWQFYRPWLRPFHGSHLELHLLRTTSHPPHPPLAVLVGMATGTVCVGGTVLYHFNPLTGEALSDEPTCLPPLLQTLLLPTLDHTHSKILLMLTTDLEVVAFPPSHDLNEILSSHHQALFISTADSASGLVHGYQISLHHGPPFSTNQIWSLSFPLDSEKLISMASKSPNEHVSSQGRVRTDRSVLFKYLNPNLVAMVTEAVELSKPFVSVYLVDRVTGGVVYHTTHKQAAGPVHLAHSENWIVYQFFNTKQRRHELVVLELYESNDNQTHTVWSSLAPPPLPDVVSQSYVFPSTLHTLTTTQTLRGITHKSILLGLHSGHIVALPKRLLDPRRAIETTDEMKEEGLPPYLPQLGLSPASFINYNNTVSRIHTIFTSPSGLESTSLVLACGLDLYFTRVTPSKQYDLLPDDFDYTFILAVVSAMVLGTFVLSKLAARKTLRALWK